MFETPKPKLKKISLICSLVAMSLLFGFTLNLSSKLYFQPELQSYGTSHPLELVDMEDYSNLVPPINVTVQERISWFKNNLPQFEIMKSTPLSMQFEDRVEEFFDDVCEIQFFMTWIAPVSLFGEREILAIDSLFRAHPNGCLMIISRTMDSSRGLRILNPITDRGFKVVAVTPDLSLLFKDTPAESWFIDMKSGKKDPGEILLAQNLSNLIRLVVLYKYGGVYLDTDFIVLKDLSGLRNSIGAQSTNHLGQWTRLNNAVLIFDKNHPLLYKFIEEFASTFNGNKWGHNGPYLVSRVVSNLAADEDFDFTVLPRMAFYPVDWGRVYRFFIGPDQIGSEWIEEKLQQLSDRTYAVHLWNKLSGRIKIEQGSIMQRLISEHCTICESVYSF